MAAATAATATNKQQPGAKAPAAIAANHHSPPSQAGNRQPAQQKISSPKLLSPNAACEPQVAAGRSQANCRRKSTLSANGFFIDYSCTRRRSSAALQQQQARAQTSLDPLAKNQFLRQVISPTGTGAAGPSGTAAAGHRRPSTAPMVAAVGALSSTGATGRDSFSAPSQSSRVNSRASYSSGSAGQNLLRLPGNHHLQRQSMSGGLMGPLGGAARSLAGSRKTSIFDPVGHSLLAPAGDPRRRRKSTMVAGGAGGLPPPLPALEQAATMLAVSRQAAALRRDRMQGSARLAERVPVIGCSPTSICASLAALDETRRYEKLLRKLEDHKARRARERRKLERRTEEDELMCDIDLESYGESEDDNDDDNANDFSSSSSVSSSRDATESGSSDGENSTRVNKQQQQRTVSALLRRKSQRALRDVGVLLNKVAQAQRKRRRRRKRRWRLSSAGAWRKSHGAGDPFVDGLSISSTLSFVSASQTSLHSIERFLDGLSLEQANGGYDDDEDVAESTESEDEIEYDDDDGAACHSGGYLAGGAHDDENEHRARNSRGQADGNRSRRPPTTEPTLGSALDLSHRHGGRRRRSVGEHNNEGQQPPQAAAVQGGLTNSSLVRRAMRRIAATLASGKRNRTVRRGSGASRGCRRESEWAASSGNQRAIAGQTANKTFATAAASATSTTTTTRAGYEDNELNSAHKNNGGEGNKRGGHERRRRRRSVSMSAGLNYWHYYYYLRNNSLDDLPGAFELGATGGGGCGATSASALYLPIGSSSGGGGGGGSDHHSADCQHLTAAGGGGGPAPLLIGTGGSPMSESERRTRLYVNYSLARLEILNCRTDPVARLATKIEQASSAAAAAASVSQQADSQWDCALAASANEELANNSTGFEFAQSSDSEISLSLSTSSTDLNSSDTSRNSSSLSSRVASTTTTSNECSLAATAAPVLAAATKTNRAGKAPYRREASLSSSVLSSSSRASLATVKSRGQARALNGATSGLDEPAGAGSLWQGQRQHHHIQQQPLPPSADWQVNSAEAMHQQHLEYLAPDDDELGRQQPPPTRGGVGGHLARDAHFRFSVKSTRSSASSVWSSRQSSAESPALKHQPHHVKSHVQPQQQPLRQFISSGLSPVPGANAGGGGLMAWDRRQSRTFLSWDRLEMTGLQQQHAPSPLHAINSGGSVTATMSQPNKRRPVRHRLLSSSQLGGSSESAASSSTLVAEGAGRADRNSTGLAVYRRSFKQLRGNVGGQQQHPPAATSSPVGTRRWYSSSLVSRSKSFLFQRRASAKRPSDKSSEQSGPVVVPPPQPPPHRDEQREAADKLLEQFEAQMSEAANLAHEQQHQQLRQKEQQQQQQQQAGSLECKSRLQSSSSRRSTVSSSPTSSLESGGASEQRQELHKQQQAMRKSALCLNGADAAASNSQQLDPRRPLQARARSSTSLLASEGQQQQQSCQQVHNQQKQFATAAAASGGGLQVANQQLGNRLLTSGGGGGNGANDAAAISAGPSPTRSSLRPTDANGASQLHGRYASDISLQQSGGFHHHEQQQLASDLHWHHQHQRAEFNHQSSTGSGGSSTSYGRANTNQNSFESAAGQTPTCGGSGERLYGARKDLTNATSGLLSGGLATATADGIRMRAHSTGAGDGGAPFDGGLHLGGVGGDHGPQQMHANSMQALARRTSREVRAAGQLCAAMSNESVRDVRVSRRPSPTGSSGAGGADRSAPFADKTNERHVVEAQPTRHRRETMNGDSASLHAQAVSVLRKSSFTCTVLGARQTGKRSIVICFVKLLNEFKLAADECKKEEMLTKLVECSERLQELASRAEDQEQQEAVERAQQQQRRAMEVGEEEAGRGGRQRRTSRLNSWLPSSGAVRHLLNLSPVSAKRRLNSVVSPLLTARTTTKSHGDQERHQELSQRRHTTFEPPSSQQLQSQRAGIQSSSSSRLLSVQTAGGDNNNLLSSSCQNANKSDTNISYQTTQFDCGPRESSQTGAAGGGGHQLQVPSLDAAMLRKHSDPTGFRGAQQQQERLSTQSPGSVFLHEGAESQVDGASPTLFVSGQRRHTTLVGLPDTCNRRRNPGDNKQHGPPNSSKRLGGHRTSGNHARRQSICLSRRRRRVLLSLKELNRRKFSIRFSTRRQISESLVAQIRAAHAERQQAAASARGRRRSTILQLTGGSTPGQHTNSLVLPDSFLVIYSINDRDSFEYAKSLVGQLRSLASQQAQEIPLPIVLVANKSDLERNREVKAADGRAVAKRYACKFIEISCTIGFNLDNLLVGLRTQLVLKHHIVLNSILRPGFRYKARYMKALSSRQPHDNGTTKMDDYDNHENKRRGQATVKDKRGVTNKTAGDNILIRLCKRYVMDSNENDYDCDNFSKL